MGTIEILRTVSKLVYENVKDLAGTAEAASGDFWERGRRRYFKKY